MGLFGSVTTIGNEAFRNCVNITELTLPASLTSIGAGLMEGCTKLNKLVVGSDPERLERKYVCVSAEVSGYTMDASMLGGEYSLTFHPDGTVGFVMVGASVPGLRWTQGRSRPMRARRRPSSWTTAEIPSRPSARSRASI